MTKEIRKSIKMRKQTNRERRKEQDETKKEILKDKYIKLKNENKTKIWERRQEYDKIRSEEVKNNPNKIWDNIRRLRDKREDKQIELYNENGEKIEETEVEKELKQYWEGIYQKHENKINDSWNQNDINKLNTIIQEQIYSKETREHFDMVMKTENEIKEMEECIFEEEEVKEVLNRIKNKKAPGPDGLKGELYKV